jgi:hypothetical protein
VQVPAGTGPDGAGPEFFLTRMRDTVEVAEKFHQAFSLPETEIGKAAKKWLAQNDFSALFPPGVLYSWYLNRGLYTGGSVFFKRIVYDVLHAYYIGLLARFEDSLVLIICNSHATNELGYRAVGVMEARLASIPSFATGFRVYRAYPGGFVRRRIFSGNDRYFFIVMFAAAIGLDDSVIPDAELRASVLSGIEAAAVLAELLRAEALTHEGRMAVFLAVRTFLLLLVEPTGPFVNRQRSHYAIIKFHMMLHIVNWLSCGAPACTNTSKFEAALRILVTRIARRATNNHDLLQSITDHYTYLAALTLMKNKGGDAGKDIAGASVPSRLRQRRRAIKSRNAVLVDVLDGSTAAKSKPVASILDTIVRDWSMVEGNQGKVRGEVVDFAHKAVFYDSFRLTNPKERFVALVHQHATVELDVRVVLGNNAMTDAQCEPHRTNPRIAVLGRVKAIFYLHPPAPGAAADGFPSGVAAAAQSSERMFVLIDMYEAQLAKDTGTLENMRMQYHTIRRPYDDSHMFVYPLSTVLRAVRTYPLLWPSVLPVRGKSGQNKGQATPSVDHAQLVHAAACSTGPVLIFWPPTRHTFLPTDFAPAEAEGANEEEDEYF